MCGIVAYSGDYDFNPDKIKLLLLYNEHRGPEASGYYNLNTELPFDKRVTKALGKVSDKLAESYVLEPSTLFLGHVRKKSSGVNNVESAHPFIEGDYIGVHNGTFKNYDKMCQTLDIDKTKYSVDSRGFYHLLSRTNDFKKCISYTEGGAVLIYTHKDNQDDLVIYRNEDRPLYRGTIKNAEGKKGMYFSSLKEGLHAIGCSGIKEITPEHVYTVTKGKIAFDKSKVKKVELPKTEEETTFGAYSDYTVMQTVKVPKAVMHKNLKKTGQYDYNTQKLFLYNDNTFSVQGSHQNFVEDIKNIQLLKCNSRDIYVLRHTYGWANSLKTFEINLSQYAHLFESKEHPEAISNLLYTLYGELSAVQMGLAEQENSEANALQASLLRMEQFLGLLDEK